MNWFEEIERTIRQNEGKTYEGRPFYEDPNAAPSEAPLNSTFSTMNEIRESLRRAHLGVDADPDTPKPQPKRQWPNASNFRVSHHIEGGRSLSYELTASEIRERYGLR